MQVSIASVLFNFASTQDTLTQTLPDLDRDIVWMGSNYSLY